MSLTRRRRLAVVAPLTALIAMTAAVALSRPAPASAEPHCPEIDPNPSKACGGIEPTTTTRKRTTGSPTEPVAALEPMVFIEVGGACAFGPVGSAAASQVSGLLGGNGHSTCVGPDLRIGAWPTYQSPSAAAAVNRLKLMHALQAGETYTVRISERYLQDMFGAEMEKNRGRIEGGGRRLTSYGTHLAAPDLVQSRITVKKTLFGFEGRASADITDRIFVRDGDLACTSNTSIDTNAAADIGQALGDFTHFTFDDDKVDIRGSFRAEIAKSGSPGCLLATMVPDYVLLPPLPVVGALRVNFTPTRAGVLNGAFEVGGTWAQVARDARLGLSIAPGAGRWANGGVDIPVRVSPRDLSGWTHLKVSAFGKVQTEVDLPAPAGQTPPAQVVMVHVSLPFSEGAKATLVVEARDSNGIARTSQISWAYMEKVERVPIPCAGATPKTKTGSQPGGNCQSPGFNPHEPPVASLNPQPEPPGVR